MGMVSGMLSNKIKKYKLIVEKLLNGEDVSCDEREFLIKEKVLEGEE